MSELLRMPRKFWPDEEAYLAFRELAPRDFCHEVERLIAAKVSVEQMVAIMDFDRTCPPAMVEVIGAALAYWVLRAQEQV